MNAKEDFENHWKEIQSMCMEFAVNEGLNHIVASVEAIVDDSTAPFESEEDRKEQMKYLLVCILAECKAINAQLKNVSFDWKTTEDLIEKIEAL